MELLSIKQTSTGFYIEGFPDAVKVIKIKGDKAQRLSNLALHKKDLDSAKKYLDVLGNVGHFPDSDTLRESLWCSAITIYFKCFGTNKSRFSLVYKTIYPEKLAQELFLQFKDLRDKHIVHDENSYAQSVVGAILNKPGGSFKIAKIVNLNIFAGILFDCSYNNLKLLIEEALVWVITQYDSLCNALSQ
jgi:hypothetical protein